MPGGIVDGQGLAAGYEFMDTAVERGTSGGGPAPVEGQMYRTT